MKPNPRVRSEGETGVEYIVRRIREVLAGDGTVVELAHNNEEDEASVLFWHSTSPCGQLDVQRNGHIHVSLGEKPPPERLMLPHQFMKVVADTVLELGRRRHASAVLRVMRTVKIQGESNIRKLMVIAAQRALLMGGQLKSKMADYTGPKIRIGWANDARDEQEFDSALAFAREQNVARLLAGMPTNLLGTETFAETIHETANDMPITHHTWQFLGDNGEPTEEEYARMGLLQAVGRASVDKPRVIAIQIDPVSGPTEKRRVLVGKGLVNDTGGLNLKPDGGRDMRGDKGGACALLALALTTARLQADLRVSTVFVFGIVENCIGSHAYRPGDVLTAYDGKTVEVWNTDAEGRLVLYDCIAWIGDHLKLGEGDVVVTIATLTGGAVIALGAQYTALYLKESPWRLEEVRRLEQTGLDLGDPVNILHWDEAEAATLGSKVADTANAAPKKERPAQQGATFVMGAVPKGVDFMHLDIAGSNGDFSGGNGCQPGTVLPGGIGFLAGLLLSNYKNDY